MSPVFRSIASIRAGPYMGTNSKSFVITGVVLENTVVGLLVSFVKFFCHIASPVFAQTAYKKPLELGKYTTPSDDTDGVAVTLCPVTNCHFFVSLETTLGFIVLS
jgi:hypothetical protein